MTSHTQAAEAARHFLIDGRLAAIAPYGSGHINDTFCAVFDRRGAPARSILQRINTAVFTNPAALMENVQRVTAHLAARLADEPDRARRVLALIPARSGQPFHVDAEGGCWRAYRFLEGARSYDAVESTAQAFQAGRAFGRFQQLLADLPAPRLNDTIPDFHHTPRRFAAFEQAVAADAAGRAIHARAEIGFALAHRSMTGELLNAGLPERVTHNDTKFNNVMLDEATGEGLCVIDLDTVMPGLALYDFGDMVRTTTSPAMEDERDLSKVDLQFPMFEALVRGYLSTAGGFLTKAEKDLLAFSGKLITFEIGIRFLTDYLAGDTYFKIHRQGHNLDRCRTQFKLVESIENQEEAMNRLIESISI
ncbi:MAG: aminoglycoside phosphotransferase family protein [Terracidiphilus sp.]|nr:aminoglycoside phosphotransferase family protein [Terracidiphilus sp.]